MTIAPRPPVGGQNALGCFEQWGFLCCRLGASPRIWWAGARSSHGPAQGGTAELLQDFRMSHWAFAQAKSCGNDESLDSTHWTYKQGPHGMVNRHTLPGVQLLSEGRDGWALRSALY